MHNSKSIIHSLSFCLVLASRWHCHCVSFSLYAFFIHRMGWLKAIILPQRDIKPLCDWQERKVDAFPSSQSRSNFALLAVAFSRIRTQDLLMIRRTLYCATSELLCTLLLSSSPDCDTCLSSLHRTEPHCINFSSLRDTPVFQTHHKSRTFMRTVPSPSLNSFY